jgi:hypothetical protein
MRIFANKIRVSLFLETHNMSQYEFLEKMDKTKFRIVKRGEEDNDVEFLQSQPYEVRLLAIEMRRLNKYRSQLLII